MVSPGYIQFRMIIQSGQGQPGKFPGRCGPLKNFRFRLVSRNPFSLRLSGVRLSKSDVICSGDRGPGSNLTPAAAAAMSLNDTHVVSQTFCMCILKKDKNRKAPAQPWPEGIISTVDGFLLEHQRKIRPETDSSLCGALRRIMDFCSGDHGRSKNHGRRLNSCPLPYIKKQGQRPCFFCCLCKNVAYKPGKIFTAFMARL
jgi:hypothetical protein